MRAMEDALLLYILRDARVVDPDGWFDKQGRWWADENTEERQCCKRKYPSRRRMYRQMIHCRTLKHICTLYDVDYDEAYRELHKPHWRTLRKLARFARNITGDRHARPTMHEYASYFVDLLARHANLFTEDGLKKTACWLAQYDPRAETIDWDGARAIAAMRDNESRV